jgi:hypothetical protein
VLHLPSLRVGYVKFYPSAVSDALILDGINEGLPHVALFSSPQRFLLFRLDFAIDFVNFAPDTSIAFLHVVIDDLLL